ncbi:MOSC domain-containing protein [Litoribacter populi]|uniref:MOSC domain-containing protein n=1 Tax=Litoribacter populi TaxID=2598460 RepID=UPI00118067CD|nr:MOSC N-terminal beta barrel domain-containing protein [Litoribacter populi]
MRLKDIYIYPVKSLGGIRLDKATVDIKGFEHDRRWMVVDDDGQFITQRRFPQMALLQPELHQNGLKIHHKNDQNKSILVPMDPETGKKMMVTVWDDSLMAEIVNQEVDQWLSEILDINCHLVKMDEMAERPISSKYSINDETVSFADSMPYMVIGQSSLDNLNSRLEEEVKMDRFRPNLVFEGGEPFEEDSWQVVQIGECMFQVTKPCARCVMVTIDQQTSEKGKEPLKTLATFRKEDQKILFGQNMIAVSLGEIAIGDPVERLIPET